MPGFDKAGPMGQGPLTGRRRGPCRDVELSNEKQSANIEEQNIIYGVGKGGRPWGGGKGYCFGGGRGRGRRFGNR